MELTPEQNAIYATALKNYLELTTYIGLSRIDALKPGAGKWLVDYIKQLQTSIGIAKTMQMQRSAIQNVEATENTQLPPLTPFGLVPDTSMKENA